MAEQTAHQPLTDQQLDEIETRASHLHEYATLTDVPLQVDADQTTGEDVPALLAEVRRLRAELATALRPNTPRLCACGHSNLAHTVPEPHSCFAHGQTCTCESYRQLPHDEAVAQLERNRRAAAEREEQPTVAASEACGKCKQPFDATDTSSGGHGRFHLTPYCRRCVDLCHEGGADHRCVICA